MGNIEASRRSCRCRLEHTALIEADINAIFLHLLYALASPSISILYAPEPHTFPTRGNRRFGEHVMGILDGVSLLLAVGLFVYLLVALLRADRN